LEEEEEEGLRLFSVVGIFNGVEPIETRPKTRGGLPVDVLEGAFRAGEGDFDIMASRPELKRGRY